MQLTGIDATLKRLAEQVPKGQVQPNASDSFQTLIETLGSQIKAAIQEASSRPGSSHAASPATPGTAGTRAVPATPATPDLPEVATTRRLTAFQQSVLRSSAPMLEQLSHDLRASDPQYNERETQLRGGLDLDAIEGRLRASAKRLGVDYDKSDLEGILRNAGYGAAHLGSTERYMSAVENFLGVAQVPIGLAGPLRVNGEHAQGDFLVPLATTEGTLVASYSRGMKVLNLAGGVTCTVVGDAMQRAPVFVFDSAREARDFNAWVNDPENMAGLRQEAEATSSVAKLLYIDIYLAAKFAYLRFNYSTGDAAGQNMVGRATFAACSWVLEQPWPKQNVRRFYLESNLATDKKASQVNVMRTRGKRVVAECSIPRDVLVQHMRVEPESLAYHAQVANVGAFLSGANNNGCHSPNGITAMFIATGQDVANVSESSAAIVYTEIEPSGALYISITIPSLIVATHGGGTALPTQRECLDILGCTGRGKVRKLAEIVAGVALAGEISLASAISSLDWVSSHEKYGRNR